MIAWWSFPLVCTLLATLAVIWVGFFAHEQALHPDGSTFEVDIPYKDFVAAGLAFVCIFVCSAVWLFAFIIKIFTGQ